MVDRPRRRVGGRRAATNAVLCPLLGLALGLTGCSAGPAHDAATAASPAVRWPAAPSATTPSAAAGTTRRPVSADHAVAPLPRSRPVRLTIHRIGVDAPLVAVARAADGTVATPPFSEPLTAGWFNGSVTPGEQGTAVVVGHVDTRTGPAVFFPLSVTRPGDQVLVRRADRSVADFTVDKVTVIPREDFDDARVYGRTGRPELRLITCGGTFDRHTQEYSSNVVVYAHLTGASPR